MIAARAQLVRAAEAKGERMKELRAIDIDSKLFGGGYDGSRIGFWKRGHWRVYEIITRARAARVECIANALIRQGARVQSGIGYVTIIWER